MRLGHYRYRDGIILLSALLIAMQTHATEKRAADEEIDADFLEYLASVEGKDENWTDIEADTTVKSGPAPQDQTAKSSKAPASDKDEEKQ